MLVLEGEVLVAGDFGEEEEVGGVRGVRGGVREGLLEVGKSANSTLRFFV